VLLATGGRPRRLTVPGGDHPAVTTLRTLSDAETLRERLDPGARVGVIGGGLIGAEVTSTAVTRGCDVTLLDPTSRPLTRAVGPEIAEILHAQHRRHGVRVLAGAVSAVEDRGSEVRLRVAGSAETVDCDVVVVGIGIEQDVSLAVLAGVATRGGILVDEAQRTSHPRIFAAGDVARPRGASPPSEHWDAALHEGMAAAAALLGQAVPAGRVPWFWSDRYDTHLEVLGEPYSPDAPDTAGTRIVRGELTGDSFTALTVRDGRCVGAVSINRPAEMRAVRRLIERYLPGPIDQLADDSVDLRTLVRG